MTSYKSTHERLFDIRNAEELTSVGEARILVDKESGTVFFQHGRYGIAFNPKVGAWSAPLDFGNSLKDEKNEN